LFFVREPCLGHPAPFSYLDIAFRGGNIEGSLTVHVIDIAHELNVTPPERVLDPEFLARERQRILDVLTPRISLSTDRPLTIEWGNASADERGARTAVDVPNSQ
jgi:hypothetical protein